MLNHKNNCYFTFLHDKWIFWNMMTWEIISLIKITMIQNSKVFIYLNILNIKPVSVVIMKRWLNCSAPYVVTFIAAFILITCNFYSQPLFNFMRLYQLNTFILLHYIWRNAITVEKFNENLHFLLYLTLFLLAFLRTTE